MKITFKKLVSGITVSFLCAGTLSMIITNAASARGFGGGHIGGAHIGGSHLGGISHGGLHNGMRMGGERGLSHERFGREGFRHEGFRKEGFRDDRMARRDEWGRGRDRNFDRRLERDRFRHDELAERDRHENRYFRAGRIRRGDQSSYGTTAYVMPEQRRHEGTYFNVGR